MSEARDDATNPGVAPPVLAEVGEDGVAVVTLNRPEKRNAIDLAMVEALHAALDDLAARPSAEVRALVLTGAGEKAFAGGADIRQLRERDALDALRGINARLFQKVEDFPWPTVAAVRGFALGGGCELAMACDLRVAGEGARFGQPESNLGILAGAGATFRLARLVGLGRAKELLLTGRVIDAAEAERIGLVNRVVPDGDVAEAARALARTMAERAPLAQRLTKLAANTHARGGDPAVLDMLAQGMLFESEDKREGMDAFLEKRPPRFRGK